MKKILMAVLLAQFWLSTIPALAGWATQSGADHVHGDSSCVTHADDRTACGPFDFVIGNWHVALSHHIFNLEAAGDRVIVVTKTTPDRVIRGGFLILNRQLIPLSSFLRGDEIVFQKVRFLQPSNRLTVFFRGTPGASVRIAVKPTGSPVAPPQVTFSADPPAIHSGESSRLIWTSAHADSVSIDHGIGPVAPDGSLSVAPLETTPYTLTASHSGGSATAEATIQVIPGSLSIAITHPAQGEPFSTEFITVSGTVSRPDAAVWVNGVLATVNGGEYTARQVALVPGANTIGVLAQDGTATAVAGVTVRLITAIDLAPVHVEIAALPAGDGSPNVSGQAMVTVANNGSSAVATPYRIVLFEDTNLSGGYEATQDNRLGQATMAAGPGAGEATTITIEFIGQLLFRDNRMHVCVDSHGAAEDFFGDGVALDGHHVIVGARLDDDKGDSSGSAYVYPLFSVSIGADPESILLGGEGSSFTTLSWTSRGAESLRIDPDIGSVAASGWLRISPQQTTTYTITGTKDGATVTDSVTIAVIDPSKIPTVTIAATPATIERGAFATLAWSATEVDKVALDNGIGGAPMTGSLAVFPVETTTYTVTAENAGGTATANATISVTDPLPTVELSVEPAEVTAGESATLAWRATHADSVSIQPGIGLVEPNGTHVVAPMQTTAYTITASGSGGTATQSATVTVTSPISIQILSPLNGGSVDRPDVMVNGTFVNTSGHETGITVNGMVAMVYGDRFVVNRVALEQGANTIAVTATDASGFSQTASATINATIPEHHIRLFPTIACGSSPLVASLHLSGTFGIQDATLSHTGAAPVELIEIEPDEYRVRMVDPGITYFTAEAVHAAVTYTDTIAVMVVDAAMIDALLQQKWSDMKTMLGNGDIPGALNHFSEGTRPIFECNFNLLNANLDEIIAGMQSITLVKIEENRAEYNLVGQQAGQAFSFYLLFQKAADGTWRIVNF